MLTATMEIQMHKLENIFPWNHNYSVVLTYDGMVKVIDHTTGTFITLMTDKETEFKWLVSHMKGARTN